MLVPPVPTTIQVRYQAALLPDGSVHCNPKLSLEFQLYARRPQDQVGAVVKRGAKNAHAVGKAKQLALRSATLVCSRDSEDEAFHWEIDFTDFPIEYMKLYVEGGVLLLSSEH